MGYSNSTIKDRTQKANSRLIRIIDLAILVMVVILVVSAAFLLRAYRNDLWDIRFTPVGDFLSKSYKVSNSGEGAQVIWTTPDTLSAHIDMAPFTQAVGNRFSFIYPVISGYRAITVKSDNCQVALAYHDPETDVDYVHFDFDNTDDAANTALDFDLLYDVGSLMTGREIKLPAYQPSDNKETIVSQTAGSVDFPVYIHSSMSMDEIITQNQPIAHFAQNITSVQSLIKKLDEHFTYLGASYDDGLLGYRNNFDSVRSDAETYATGGNCLDLAYLVASIAQKSGIDGLNSADVISGCVRDKDGEIGIHAVTQLDIDGNLYYIDATQIHLMAVHNLSFYVDSSFVPIVSTQYIYGAGSAVYRDQCQRYQTDLSFPPFGFDTDNTQISMK